MKRSIIYLPLLFGLFIYTGCEIYDPIDEIARVGEVTPHVYWELPSNAVRAGNSVDFTVQYYTTAQQPVDRLEVWYDITELEKYSASCPLVSTFTYEVSSESSAQARIFQKIAAYEHREENWNEQKRAYYLTSSFPTSNTLQPTSWTKVEVFEQEKMDSFFPENFEEEFKKGLFEKLQVADYRKMMSELSYIEDSVFVEDYILISDEINPNTGEHDVSIRPEKMPVLQAMLDTTAFEKLIYSANDLEYKIQYEKSYRLGAQIKVFDITGLNSYSELKTIDVQ